MAITTSSSISNYYCSIRLMFVVLLIGVCNAQLSTNFYSTSCPTLLNIVSSIVNSNVTSELRMGASLLRLHFHDCFVQGCDASVLLDDTATFTGEKTAAPNINSLRGFDVIDTIKSQVEAACNRTVSCADILALAARDSVVALGGQGWQVGLGRNDSRTANLTGANSEIPAPTLNLNALITSFTNKGFTANEMVALSGSHTIGQARCTNFRARIYNESNINSTFATSRKANCLLATGTSDNNLAPLDITPTAFNNDYFGDLLMLSGLLHSDQQLFSGGTTDAQVTAYSTNATLFASDFANAMVKMSNLSPPTGSAGEIRTNCRRTN